MSEIILYALFALFYAVPILVILRYFRRLKWTRQINIVIAIILLESALLFITDLLFQLFGIGPELTMIPLIILWINSMFLIPLILAWVLLLGVLYIVKGNKIL